MGRSRGALAATPDRQRTRKTRNSSAAAASSSQQTAADSASSDSKKVEGKKALYHCNYCTRDISGKIHVKCAICPDFDLCMECFSVGAEVTPHKSDHPYQVTDDLSFPLLSPDWNADEEILLLEAIEMYGLGDWDEIAEHVGTKGKAQCIEHYTSFYLNSPNFPLPDMSHVTGKNRKGLQSSVKGHTENSKELSTLGELRVTEQLHHSGFRTGEPALGLSRFNWFGAGFSNITAAEGTVKMASGMDQIKHSRGFPNVKDSVVVPSIGFGGQKPELSSEEGPSLLELSGYNPKRNEFDPEYDIDAEKLIANLEFKDTDTEAEHELKLRMLHIYNRRLDERKRRKDFVLERNLLYPDPLAKDLSPQEKELYGHYNVYMRFHSKEEHEELLKTVMREHRIRKRIEELQEAQENGCRTSAEADEYFEHKRKKIAEECSRETKGRGKVLQRVSLLSGVPDGSPLGGVKEPATVECRPKDSSSSNDRRALACSTDDWGGITGLPGFCLLSEAEKRLCCETKILPSHYLKLQEVISVEVLRGNITKKSDAHRFFKEDPNKVDRVYDMLVRKGIALP
ncbi:hypothetical protein AQUCO_00500284v1 [Aquilegia coerulea]|uniref:Transcriptional adapter n=1 Tax=Aquilegia coerulea TaxID=218851 RepID=A0A2G5ER65_AQUCA|nr:hypothetical protein AQUCO_00500284v1 [Aquilegia coerulea]PIA58230.1 hypothetical protein AQUCO_00500284v1 [Aquilegia coerulea]